MYDTIALFIKLVETGNYTKAATMLNTSQATLSRKIQILEQELEVELVRRNNRVFELTEQGDLLYKRLVEPVKQLQVKLSDFNENKHAVRGTLKIALPAALSYELITPKISSFTNKYPEVKILLDYSSNPIDLMRNDYNIAVSTIMPISQTSKVRLLKTFNFKLYATPQYIERYGMLGQLDDIQQHKIIGLIGLDGNLRFSYPVKNLVTGVETVINHEANIYINNIIHGVQLAKTGHYIVGGWDELLTQELKSGELLPVLPEYIFGEMPCYLVRHNRAASNLENLFAEFLMKCFAN
ncbi:MAG: LysR family transcriptional regulator [Neisseriales bacterium]|nr:MAG: LysR family transcriptional regulator [Neisseriales bacterium]